MYKPTCIFLWPLPAHFSPHRLASDAFSCSGLLQAATSQTLYSQAVFQDDCWILVFGSVEQRPGRYAAGWVFFVPPVFTKGRRSRERDCACDGRRSSRWFCLNHFMLLFAFERVRWTANGICLQRLAETCRSSLAEVMWRCWSKSVKRRPQSGRR